MLKPLIVPILALCLSNFPLAAQVAPSPFGAFGEKPMDPARMTAMMANARRTLRPASFVLEHKSELALTTEQVQQLQALARTQEDSIVVRQIRMTSAMAQLAAKRAVGAPPQTGWVTDADPKQIRQEACEMSNLQADATLNLMRDRRAVGNILTGVQIDQLPHLETGDMMRAMTPNQP